MIREEVIADLNDGVRICDNNDDDEEHHHRFRCQKAHESLMIPKLQKGSSSSSRMEEEEDLHRHSPARRLRGWFRKVQRQRRNRRLLKMTKTSEATAEQDHPDSNHPNSSNRDDEETTVALSSVTSSLRTSGIRRTRSQQMCSFSSSISSVMSRSPSLPASAMFVAASNASSSQHLPSLPPPQTTQQQTAQAPLCYRLTEYEWKCFGYLQFQHEVSSMQEYFLLAKTKTRRPLFCVRVNAKDECGLDAARDVFTNPLVVEALESLFVTILIKEEEEEQSQQLPSLSALQQSQQQPDHSNSNNASSGNRDSHHTTGFLAVAEFLEPDHPSTSTNYLAASIPFSQLSVSTLVSSMAQALETTTTTNTNNTNKAEKVLPTYLQLLGEEQQGSSDVRRAYFGADNTDQVTRTEGEFAALSGVLTSAAGRFVYRHDRRDRHHDRRHSDGEDEYENHNNAEPSSFTVQVEYDSSAISYATVVRYALEELDISHVICRTSDERVAAKMEVSKRRHHALYTVEFKTKDCVFRPSPNNLRLPMRRTPFRYVPLTDLQATRANGLIYKGCLHEAVRLLSPRQNLIFMEASRYGARDFHDVVGYPILDAWLSVSSGEAPKRVSEEVSEDSSSADHAPELFHHLLHVY